MHLNDNSTYNYEITNPVDISPFDSKGEIKPHLRSGDTAIANPLQL